MALNAASPAVALKSKKTCLLFHAHTIDDYSRSHFASTCKYWLALDMYNDFACPDAVPARSTAAPYFCSVSLKLHFLKKP